MDGWMDGWTDGKRVKEKEFVDFGIIRRPIALPEVYLRSLWVGRKIKIKSRSEYSNTSVDFEHCKIWFLRLF